MKKQIPVRRAVDGPCFWEGRQVRTRHELYVKGTGTYCRQCGKEFDAQGNEIERVPVHVQANPDLAHIASTTPYSLKDLTTLYELLHCNLVVTRTLVRALAQAGVGLGVAIEELQRIRANRN